MRFIPAVSPVQIQVPLPGPKDGPWPSFGAHFKQGPLGQLGPLVKWLRHRPFTAVTRVRVSYGSPYGGVAQPVEHLLHTQGVTDSSSVVSTKKDHTVWCGPFSCVWRSLPRTGTLPRRARPRGRPLAMNRKACYFKYGAAQTAGSQPHSPHAETRKGGEAMRITLHIGIFTVTIIVKSRNRHPGR